MLKLLELNWVVPPSDATCQVQDNWQIFYLIIYYYYFFLLSIDLWSISVVHYFVIVRRLFSSLLGNSLLGGVESI